MQSNAMYALSLLAKRKGWEFLYYTRINESLLHHPKGNLQRALANGMQLRKKEDLDIADPNTLAHTLWLEDRLVIPEGGRCAEAYEGIAILAQEIIAWAKEKKRESLDIFLPSGTGATALFLQKALTVANSPFRVYTVSCVGKSDYLRKQFEALEADRSLHPTILEPPKNYRFGHIYAELFTLWQQFAIQTGITLDLLYDPIGIATLLTHRDIFSSLLYIHQGGIEGNETMIERYKKKFGKIISIKYAGR